MSARAKIRPGHLCPEVIRMGESRGEWLGCWDIDRYEPKGHLHEAGWRGRELEAGGCQDQVVHLCPLSLLGLLVEPSLCMSRQLQLEVGHGRRKVGRDSGNTRAVAITVRPVELSAVLRVLLLHLLLLEKLMRLLSLRPFLRLDKLLDRRVALRLSHLCEFRHVDRRIRLVGGWLPDIVAVACHAVRKVMPRLTLAMHLGLSHLSRHHLRPGQHHEALLGGGVQSLSIGAKQWLVR